MGADAQLDALSCQLRAKLTKDFTEPDGFEQFRQRLYVACVEVLAALRQRFFDGAAGVFAVQRGRQRHPAGGTGVTRQPSR